MRITLLTLLTLFCSILNASKHNAELKNYTTQIIYDGKKVVENIEVELQINNAKGAQYAEIAIPYSDTYSVKNIKASIHDFWGNEIRKLKKKDIIIRTPYSESEFYTDQRLMTFDLIHNRFPYTIKYSYSYTIKNYISLADWNPALWKDVPVKSASLSVEVPLNEELNIYNFKTDTAYVVKNEESKTLHWQVNHFEYPEYESYAPHLKDQLPHVVVIPHQFTYGIPGSANTWKEFGNWHCYLAIGLDVLTEQEKNKVHQLTDHLPNKTEKIKTLYHYMQDNTRYIYVSEDIGGLVPHPATYVCNNKHGDCKALSNYTMALLKEAGIESIYTTIYAGDKPNRINSDFPSNQFNHIILCVPLEKDTIWLECTDKTSPFNYLGTFTQNRKALLNIQDNSKLMQTPALSLNESLDTYYTQIHISDTVSFECNANLRGASFDNLKAFNNHLSESDKKESIDYIGFNYKTDVEEFKINRPHRDSCFIHLLLKGKVDQLYEKLGTKFLLSPFRPIMYQLTPDSTRQTDVFISSPFNRCDTVAYHFNKPIQKLIGLENISNKTPYGLYKKHFEIKENQLMVIRTFQIKQGRYLKEEYPEFNKFITESCIKDHQKAIITF